MRRSGYLEWDRVGRWYGFVPERGIEYQRERGVEYQRERERLSTRERINNCELPPSQAPRERGVRVLERGGLEYLRAKLRGSEQ